MEILVAFARIYFYNNEKEETAERFWTEKKARPFWVQTPCGKGAGVHMKIKRTAVAVCLLAVLLAACGGAPPSRGMQQRIVPEIKVAEFHAESAMAADTVQLDVSAAAQGYIGVCAQSESRLKFQVTFAENKYNYNMQGDGTPLLVPLQFGSGTYLLRVMQNVVEDKYVELYAYTLKVQLDDAFLPFLYANTVVPFTADSASTKKAQELCAGAATDTEAVCAIYDYIREDIAYDYALAQSAPKEYYANPDATLAAGKGICIDYATLAAAMLRSQGIPAKLITGYVGEENLYHAWNLFYTEESGWVTAEISAPANEWQRIDITLAATDGTGVAGDGSSYTDRYVY